MSNNLKKVPAVTVRRGTKTNKKEVAVKIKLVITSPTPAELAQEDGESLTSFADRVRQSRKKTNESLLDSHGPWRAILQGTMTAKSLSNYREAFAARQDNRRGRKKLRDYRPFPPVEFATQQLPEGKFRVGLNLKEWNCMARLERVMKFFS